MTRKLMKMNKTITHGPLGKIFWHNLRSILIFIVPCLILLTVLFQMRIGLDRRIVVNKETAATEKVARQFNEQLLKLSENVELIAYNAQTRMLFSTHKFVLSTTFIKRIDAIQQLIKNAIWQQPFVSSITVYATELNYFVLKDTAYSRKEQAANPADECPALELEAANATQGWYMMDGDCYYYYPRLADEHQLAGSVLARISRDDFSQLMNDCITDIRQQLILTDQSGIIVADSSGALVGLAYDEYISGEKKTGLVTLSSTPTLVYEEACEIPWLRLLIIAPQEQLIAQNQSTIVFMIIASLLAIFTLVFFMYLSARLLCRPYEAILHLLGAPTVLSSAEYDHKYRSIDHLGMISTLIHQKNYQYMAVRNELDEKKSMLREAQNAMLLAQMNPHFLFNTLDCINWMAVDLSNGENKVSTAICRLSQLLQISLRSTTPETVVQKEIEHARMYVEIQQIRQEHPIEVIWNVDESLADRPILCLSIQPLLENAISHGVTNQANARIEISIHQEDGKMLVVTVTDNGRGIQPEELAAIREQLFHAHIHGGKHIGLNNISCRLWLVYGENATISVDSIPGKFTTVCLHMPLGAPQVIDPFSPNGAIR